MSVHAVIVDYRSEMVESLVGQLQAVGLVEAITVVDNAAPKSYMREQAGGLVRSAYGKNLGYGAAINRALRHSRCDQFLILNPDVSLGEGAVGRLSETLRAHPKAAVVGPGMLTETGEPYPSFRSFPSFTDAIGHAALGHFFPENRFTRRYKRLDENPRCAVCVDWVSGACMLVTRQAFRAVAGFDASYFLYLEDVDFCWRVHQRGYAVVFDPEVTVTHLGGGSTKGRASRSVVAHHRSLMRYGMRSQGSTVAEAIVVLGVGGRMGVELVRSEIRRKTSLLGTRW